MDKSFVMLIASLVCFYLILDEIYGKKYITSFITNVMGSSTSGYVSVSNPGTSTTDANNNGHADVAERG